MTFSYRKAPGLLNQPFLACNMSNTNEIVNELKHKHHEWYFNLCCTFVSPRRPWCHPCSKEAWEFWQRGSIPLQTEWCQTRSLVLSTIKDSSMLHLAVPDKNGKFLRQTLEEACEVVKLYRILSIPVMDTSTQCQRPVLLQTSMRMSPSLVSKMGPNATIVAIQVRLIEY